MYRPAEADTFFYVWRLYGGGPTKKHTTLESAKAEANRLALKSPGAKFVVFRSVYLVETEQPRLHTTIYK